MNNIPYSKISCYQERPNSPSRWLIVRNLDSLIKLSISQATQFQHTSGTKAKALQQLKYVLLLGQNQITKHTQTILKALVKISQMEDIPQVGTKIGQIVQVLGFHVKIQYFLPLIMKILQHEQFKGNNRNTIVLLNILATMLSRSVNISSHLPSLLYLLKHYQNLYQEVDEGLLALKALVRTIIDISSNEIKPEDKNYPQLQQIVFQILITVQSTKSLSQDARRQAIHLLQVLSKIGGFRNVAQLHAAQIDPILNLLIQKKQYSNWTRTSKNRFKFDTILRNCLGQASRFLQKSLPVLQFMIDPKTDLDIRIDGLVLVQYLLKQQQLRQSICQVSRQIIKKVLIPAIQWKIGKPQIKIRKAGVINLIIMVERKLVTEEQLLEIIKDLLPHLKNCLSDDWAPELRLASCQLLQKFLFATKMNIGDEELKQIYPLLLQRMDDSQDPIRIKTTAVINVFLSCRYLKFSQSTLQYLIGAIFVHFDDSNSDIQTAVLTNLKHAAQINPKMVLKTAEVQIKIMKHKSNCGELIEYCQEVIEQNNS